MKEYISRDDALLHSEIIRVYSKDYGNVDVVPVEYLADIPSAEVQPVDTKEILRHLDSMMICIGNAYNTSHFLLESDMKFIEKQEKIIKELLSGMKGEGNG